MTEQEYDDKRKEILNKNLKRLWDLDKTFCESRNPYKKGDMITDHCKTIKVIDTAWGYDSNSCYPSCNYEGPMYTKKGVPFKDGSKGVIYQGSIE